MHAPYYFSEWPPRLSPELVMPCWPLTKWIMPIIFIYLWYFQSISQDLYTRPVRLLDQTRETLWGCDGSCIRLQADEILDPGNLAGVRANCFLCKAPVNLPRRFEFPCLQILKEKSWIELFLHNGLSGNFGLHTHIQHSNNTVVFTPWGNNSRKYLSMKAGRISDL